MLKYIFLTFFVLANINVYATLRCEDLVFDSRLKSDQVNDFNFAMTGPGFIVPNEHHLGKHSEVFAGLSEGIYLTVGSERGLMSSGLAKGKIKALIQVDLDPKIVVFNRVNRALLAISKDREEYLSLRLSGSHADWVRKLERQNDVSIEDRETLLNVKNWQWWNEKVQSISSWNAFHQNPKLNEDQSFVNANYLFDDVLFKHVSNLAKNRRIIIVLDSLGSDSFKKRVDGIVEALNLKISAIDMSNAWQEGYLGHENTIKFFESLKRHFLPNSQFVFTYLSQSDLRSSNSSVFKYVFTVYSSLTGLSELGLSMGTMARAEPSKNNNYRSRASRFDDF